VIANCPSCGTHYKHEPPRERVRARCGRCDAAMDLSRLRPYRIVSTTAPTPEQSRRAASHLPIGLDHPALATAIAQNVAQSVAHEAERPLPVSPSMPSPVTWEDEDPLPQIPEMTRGGIHEMETATALDHGILQAAPDEGVFRDAFESATAETASPEGGDLTTFALWLATGAIAGTGLSWTLGGTTTTGMIAGAVFGGLAGWGWRRWTSPK
jgi:hypothetical protein